MIAEAGVKQINLDLMVYNIDHETIRPVSVDLKLAWDGEGRVGAEFAHGVFEFVPAAKKPPVPRVNIQLPQKLVATPANPEPGPPPALVAAPPVAPPAPAPPAPVP